MIGLSVRFGSNNSRTHHAKPTPSRVWQGRRDSPPLVGTGDAGSFGEDAVPLYIRLHISSEDRGSPDAFRDGWIVRGAPGLRMIVAISHLHRRETIPIASPTVLAASPPTWQMQPSSREMIEQRL